MTARSAVVGRGNVPDQNPFTTLYTVPAGETVLLKSVAMSNTGAASTNVDVRLVSTDSITAFPIRQQVVGVQGSVITDLWLVLLPGDVIQARSVGSTAHVWCSGAELEGLA